MKKNLWTVAAMAATMLLAACGGNGTAAPGDADGNEGVSATMTEGTSEVENEAAEAEGTAEATDATEATKADGQTAADGTTAATAKEAGAADFVVRKGALGALKVGMSVKEVPASIEGLYDSWERKTETFSDMEGEWTETLLIFKKGGKKVFHCFLDTDGKKIYSLVLEGAASHIMTEDGIHVGYPARDLFNQKRMKWETYFEGTTFGKSGNVIYYVNSDDLVGVDIPTKASHFKPGAKISQIVILK